MAVRKLFGLGTPVVGLVVIVAGRDDARVLLAGGGHYARQDLSLIHI